MIPSQFVVKGCTVTPSQFVRLGRGWGGRQGGKIQQTQPLSQTDLVDGGHLILHLHAAVQAHGLPELQSDVGENGHILRVVVGRHLAAHMTVRDHIVTVLWWREREKTR